MVVANPPYITVKDKQENENYRKAYKRVALGRYALSVPFAERIFRLAIRDVGLHWPDHVEFIHETRVR